jgi:hypothetical protein
MGTLGPLRIAEGHYVVVEESGCIDGRGRQTGQVTASITRPYIQSLRVCGNPSGRHRKGEAHGKRDAVAGPACSKRLLSLPRQAPAHVWRVAGELISNSHRLSGAAAL